MRPSLTPAAATPAGPAATLSPTGRRAASAAVLGILISLLLVAQTALAPSARADAGGSFVGWINSARASTSLPAYSGAGDIDAVAAAWAAHLASTGVLQHNPNLRTQVHNWRYVGENVGVGPAASAVNTAFMNSPPHRANILDHDFTQVAVATATGGGRLWVVEVFRQPTGAAPSTPVAAPRPTSTPSPASAPSPAAHTSPAGQASSPSSAAKPPAPATTPTPKPTPSPSVAPAVTAKRPGGSPALGQRGATSSAAQLLRLRAAAASAGAGPAPGSPVTAALRFAQVMAATHG